MVAENKEAQETKPLCDAAALAAASDLNGENTMIDISRVHFIGVGGVGMSGIALVAAQQGLTVSGSDLRQSKYTDQLTEVGATIYIGHAASHIGKDENAPDVVVVSTAVLSNNPEYQEAQRRGIPVWHRARMLAYLGRNLKTLAVAGTHGKTTSSSMLASVLDAIGLDPTFLIGGMVRAYDTNARSGLGDYYVVEADESDKSFTYLSPVGVLVTNIEADHLDHYRDLSEIYDKFTAFIASVPKGQPVVVCGEDAALVQLARECHEGTLTYGFSQENDIVITDYKPSGVGSEFSLTFPNGKKITTSLRQNPGAHNALNAAGVLGLTYACGFDVDAAAVALSAFAGVKRRFDLVGSAAGVTIVDDYAHHPTEIAATVNAAKQLDYSRVVVLFQPHRYTRIKLFAEVLHDEFSHAFDNADVIAFMDVYSAGEAPIPGINGQTFLDVVLSNPQHPEAHFFGRRFYVAQNVASLLKPGDLLLTMGAGDVTALGAEILSELESAAR